LFVKPSRKKPVVYSKHHVDVNALAWAVDCFNTGIPLVHIMVIKSVLDIESLDNSLSQVGVHISATGNRKLFYVWKLLSHILKNIQQHKLVTEQLHFTGIGTAIIMYTDYLFVFFFLNYRMRGKGTPKGKQSC
jgi:hypothetical protein